MLRCAVAKKTHMQEKVRGRSAAYKKEAEDNKRFRNVIIRAGLVQSPVGGASAGNNLLSHNNWMYKYVITADQGEVVYIMFKYPVTN